MLIFEKMSIFKILWWHSGARNFTWF